MSDEIRKIANVIDPQFVIEGAGVLLRRSFGPSRTNKFDPFLLFDHFAFNDPIEGPIVGFPQHPHRGIETVTYMLEGNVRHRDSLGNTGVIGAGEVQWMTSGRGILHEELPKRSDNGVVDGFQLWVNLPAKLKMSQPEYKEVGSDEIPLVEQEGVHVRVVAGEYGGIVGPVTEIAAQPLYMDVTLEPGAVFSLPIGADKYAIAYLFEGQALFGSEQQLVEAVKMVVFDRGDQVRVQAAPDSAARFMFIAGVPFKEPVVPYGPFVMNTEEEIRQVFADIKNGTFAKEFV